MKRPRLRAVRACPNFILEVTFINGQRFAVDMSGDLKVYPGLKPLARGQAFLGAALGDAGWTVEWPAQDIQRGADVLYADVTKPREL
ncbi:DUF2442 domain-containing protein [Pseudomonas putida]